MMAPPSGPPTLVTERLVLRGHEAGDLDASADMWADPEVVRFIGGQTRDRQDAWFMICRLRGMWEMVGYGYWVVHERRSGTFVGEAGFMRVLRGISRLPDAPEAGWALARPAWGCGFGREIVTAIHDWFDSDGPRGVSYCVIEPGHAASIRLATRAGYRRYDEAVYRGAPLALFRRAGEAQPEPSRRGQAGLEDAP